MLHHLTSVCMSGLVSNAVGLYVACTCVDKMLPAIHLGCWTTWETSLVTPSFCIFIILSCVFLAHLVYYDLLLPPFLLLSSYSSFGPSCSHSPGSFSHSVFCCFCFCCLPRQEREEEKQKGQSELERCKKLEHARMLTRFPYSHLILVRPMCCFQCAVFHTCHISTQECPLRLWFVPFAFFILYMHLCISWCASGCQTVAPPWSLFVPDSQYVSLLIRFCPLSFFCALCLFVIIKIFLHGWPSFHSSSSSSLFFPFFLLVQLLSMFSPFFMRFPRFFFPVRFSDQYSWVYCCFTSVLSGPFLSSSLALCLFLSASLFVFILCFCAYLLAFHVHFNWYHSWTRNCLRGVARTG